MSLETSPLVPIPTKDVTQVEKLLEAQDEDTRPRSSPDSTNGLEQSADYVNTYLGTF